MKEIGFIKKIIEWFQTRSSTQLAVGGAATALMIAGIIGGVALSDVLDASERTNGTEQTEGTYATENLFPGVLEETQVTEETEMTEEVAEINVRITTTSIERDLKIKIVDENGNLVRNFPFVVTVTPKDAQNGKDYNDHDMDGIIHIKDIEGGDYKVQLQELEGIVIEKNVIQASVKAQIVYEKVEIQNEIKDESQINVSVEDTANNNVVEETPIVDTMKLVESTVTTAMVSKDMVDMNLFPASVVNGEYHEEVLLQTKVEINVPEDSETPEDTQQPETDDVQDGAETVEPEVGGGSLALRTQGYSYNTTGATQTVTIASAKISIPKNVTLYTIGNEASKEAEVVLKIADEQQLIQSYAWSILDENVAELVVAENQMSAMLSAKTEGTTTIVISFTYKSGVHGETNTCDLICEVNVVKPTDKETQLKDVDGNLLYLDCEAKTIATPADFEQADAFYGNPKYTGWQTINGQLYYFTENYEPATGKQIIGGVNYEFHEDGRIVQTEESIGIDVSKWQGEIDWATVANAGIDFAIIRCGYRGSSTGVIVEDPCFRANIKGATDNGIKVGVYFFTQAITEAEAVEEASTAISLVAGYKLSFPIYIDTEEAGGRADNLSKTNRTAIVRAFCETVKNSGYKPGIYASKFWYYDNLDVSQLNAYNIWVAQYHTECDYSGRYDMWQYTAKGTVPGIKGKVDMNIYYKKY